jgi:hypothetical protein
MDMDVRLKLIVFCLLSSTVRGPKIKSPIAAEPITRVRAAIVTPLEICGRS